MQNIINMHNYMLALSCVINCFALQCNTQLSIDASGVGVGVMRCVPGIKGKKVKSSMARGLIVENLTTEYDVNYQLLAVIY